LARILWGFAYLCWASFGIGEITVVRSAAFHLDSVTGKSARAHLFKRALGGVIYGITAQKFGVTAILVAVALLILVLLLTFKLLASPLSIDFTQRLSFELGAVTPLSQNLNFIPQPRDGPVLITIDFQVDETRGRELDSFMNELRLIHLRNGAYSWQLFADPARPNHFHVEIMMPSWSQYLLHCERITKAEKEVIDRALSLQLGENPPETRMYIRVNKTFSLRNMG
jgi:hypothetical protein